MLQSYELLIKQARAYDARLKLNVSMAGVKVVSTHHKSLFRVSTTNAGRHAHREPQEALRGWTCCTICQKLLLKETLMQAVLEQSLHSIANCLDIDKSKPAPS